MSSATAGKVVRLTIEQRGNRLDRALHIRRRRRFPRPRIALHEARAGFCLARLRQLHPADAARAPYDAAAADPRVEECKPVCRHGGEMLDHVAIASNRPCIERVARAQRGPGEGQPISHTFVSPTSYLLSPLTRLAAIARRK